MELSSPVVEELVGRIVDAIHPERIILFGSAARGEMTADSDIDVLVVVPDGVHRRKAAGYLRHRMIGFCYPVDIQVATPSLLQRHRDTIGLIYRTVLSEGRDIYVSRNA
jgi:predicted nucleotidyltransferase